MELKVQKERWSSLQSIRSIFIVSVTKGYVPAGDLVGRTVVATKAFTVTCQESFKLRLQIRSLVFWNPDFKFPLRYTSL